MKIFKKYLLVALTLMVANQTAFSQEWTAFGNDLSSDEPILEMDMSDDGQTVALASPFNNNNVGNQGSVKIYTWDGTNWIQKGNSFNGENPNDNLGFAVSLNSDGSRLVIGIPNNDDFDFDAGKSVVYSWDGNNWQQMGSSILGVGDADKSGSSVSMNSNGDIIAIGAFNNGDNAIQSGHVKIFQWENSDWVQMGSTITGESQGDRSGYSVDFNSDGTSIAIGAITNSDGGSSAGHVRVFAYDGTDWVQKGIDIDGTEKERLGRKVSLSGNGNRLAIGASINFDDNTGLARVYDWDGTAWLQMGNDFIGNNEGAELGSGVALNEDGNVLMIGSPGHEGSLPNNGQIKIYAWQSNSWVETESIEGTSNGNRLGIDVDVNLSGDYVCYPSFNIAKVLKKDMNTSSHSIDAEDHLEIKLIPNPTTDQLTINTQQEITKILITALNGQSLLETSFSNTVNVNHLPAGIYIVKIKTQSKTFVKKLIKNP